MILDTWKMITKQTKLVSSTPKNPNLLTEELKSDNVFIKLPEIDSDIIEIFNNNDESVIHTHVNISDTDERKVRAVFDKKIKSKKKQIIV